MTLTTQSVQLHGALPPDQGLFPWTPLGAQPPEPRYRLVLAIWAYMPPTSTPGSAPVGLIRGATVHCIDTNSRPHPRRLDNARRLHGSALLILTNS